MRGAPLDREEFSRWREEADRALAGARLLTGSHLHNWACFVAEQSAQLALKALLHGLGRGPWGRDLVRLGQLLEEAGVGPTDGVAVALRRLSRHHIPARYPSAYPSGSPGSHYAAADSAEAIDDAGAVMDFVDGRWRSLGD